MAYNLLGKRSTKYVNSGTSTPAMIDLTTMADIRAWGSAYYEQTDDDKLNNQSKTQLICGIYAPTSVSCKYTLNAYIYKNENGVWVQIGSGSYTQAAATLPAGDTIRITITDKVVPHDINGNAQIKVSVIISNAWIGTGSGYVQCSNQSYSYIYDLPMIEEQASITEVSFYEGNSTLIGYGIDNNTYVNNLSNKVYAITIDNPNNLVVDYYKMENPNVVNNTSNNNVVNLDFLNKNIAIETIDNQLKPIIYAYVYFTNGHYISKKLDSSNVNFIDYQLPQFTPTACVANRNGQLSGKVYLNAHGKYYNGEIGSLNQGGTYKPTIKYKFWKNGTTEPSTYDNTISASDITINDGTFSVTNLEIGSDNTSATNYFNPLYSYYIRLEITDTFNEPTTCKINIVRGKAIWTEYADRVDFEKITTRNIIADNIDFGTGIATVSGYTVTFNKTFASPPCVVVTPVTTTSGVIAIKISNVTTTGFTATTGGTTDFGNVDINWIAMN